MDFPPGQEPKITGGKSFSTSQQVWTGNTRKQRKNQEGAPATFAPKRRGYGGRGKKVYRRSRKIIRDGENCQALVAQGARLSK